jgi:hypothetical protein
MVKHGTGCRPLPRVRGTCGLAVPLTDSPAIVDGRTRSNADAAATCHLQACSRQSMSFENASAFINGDIHKRPVIVEHMQPVS